MLPQKAYSDEQQRVFLSMEKNSTLKSIRTINSIRLVAKGNRSGCPDMSLHRAADFPPRSCRHEQQ
jgi:hypothetical protein